MAHNNEKVIDSSDVFISEDHSDSSSSEDHSDSSSSEDHSGSSISEDHSDSSISEDHSDSSSSEDHNDSSDHIVLDADDSDVPQCDSSVSDDEQNGTETPTSPAMSSDSGYQPLEPMQEFDLSRRFSMQSIRPDVGYVEENGKLRSYCLTCYGLEVFQGASLPPGDRECFHIFCVKCIAYNLPFDKRCLVCKNISRNNPW